MGPERSCIRMRSSHRTVSPSTAMETGGRHACDVVAGAAGASIHWARSTSGERTCTETGHVPRMESRWAEPWLLCRSYQCAPKGAVVRLSQLMPRCVSADSTWLIAQLRAAASTARVPKTAVAIPHQRRTQPPCAWTSSPATSDTVWLRLPSSCTRRCCISVETSQALLRRGLPISNQWLRISETVSASQGLVSA